MAAVHCYTAVSAVYFFFFPAASDIFIWKVLLCRRTCANPEAVCADSDLKKAITDDDPDQNNKRNNSAETKEYCCHRINAEKDSEKNKSC